MRAFLFLVIAGCTPTEGKPTDDSATRPGPDDTGATSDTSDTSAADGLFPALAGANLVVINVDTLRADHLSPYGYGRATLPTVGGEAWTEVRGLRAVSSWTGPTTASAMTGLAPQHHGLTSLDQGTIHSMVTAPTIADALAASGYATGLFTGNLIVSEENGLGSGFDHRFEEGKEDVLRDAATHLPAALAWIDTLPEGQPFFVWAQPMDMHDPYSPAAEDLGTWSDAEHLPFPLVDDHEAQDAAIAAAWADDPAGTREQVTAVYDEQLLGLDRAVRVLLDGLAARGHADDTIVVLAADHGESLDDAGDGFFGHLGSLRYELLDVPFLVLNPGRTSTAAFCAGDSADVMPTLLTLVGVSPPADLDGVALQDGCRQWSRAVHWGALDEILYVSIADADYQLIRNCLNGSETLHDLRDGAEGVPVLTEADVPNASEQRAALDAYVAELADSRPQDSCAAR